MQHTAMIIDDSPLERFITETIMKRHLPADLIISFPSAPTALEHLQQLIIDGTQFPAVIFLDIYMPVTNGFDFLDDYLKLPGNAREQSKIIMFSSTENDEDHARMRQYPVIHKFIHKPISEDIIREITNLW